MAWCRPFTGQRPLLLLSLAFVHHARSKSIWSVGRPAGGVEVREDLPSSFEFFHDYVHGGVGEFRSVGKVVLFRGAAERMPAYHRWNDQYLRDRFGSVMLDQVETEKLETRTKLPHENWNIAQFLDKYNDSDIYSTARMPKGLAKEVFLLPFMNCGGGFTQRLQETVLWFSSGRTRSVIHNDANHNVHCVLAGTKHWILWRPDSRIDSPAMGWIQGESAAQQDPEHFKDAYGTYAGRINIDDVDLKKYPGWDRLTWWNMTMQAGDCAFIPGRWFHVVEAPAQRSISFHVWFGVDKIFSADTCERMQQRGANVSDYILRLADCGWGWGSDVKRTKCKPSPEKLEL